MPQNYKYLRLFPLTLVVYPSEYLNLHIFEPRYKQLINECVDSGETFGIPVFMGNEMTAYGTEIEILSVEKRYANGEMDIKTRGVNNFFIHDVFAPTPERLYHAGQVETLPYDDSEEDTVRVKLEDCIRDFYNLVSPETVLNFNFSGALSNHFGHKVGLSFEQEYDLLQMRAEYERQTYMLNHLLGVIPVLQETERLKDRIKQNGHFKRITAPTVI